MTASERTSRLSSHIKMIVSEIDSGRNKEYFAKQMAEEQGEKTYGGALFAFCMSKVKTR